MPRRAQEVGDVTTAQIAVGEVPEQITALEPNFSGSVDDI
jgi:hypothetical protein